MFWLIMREFLCCGVRVCSWGVVVGGIEVRVAE